jgi:hypothetical protein
MLFPIAYVKSVKADIVKNEITISLTVDLSESNLEEARDLGKYCDEDAGSVTLEIRPRQMAFKTSVEIKSFKQAVSRIHADSVTGEVISGDE